MTDPKDGWMSQQWTLSPNKQVKIRRLLPLSIPSIRNPYQRWSRPVVVLVKRQQSPGNITVLPRSLVHTIPPIVMGVGSSQANHRSGSLETNARGWPMFSWFRVRTFRSYLSAVAPFATRTVRQTPRQSKATSREPVWDVAGCNHADEVFFRSGIVVSSHPLRLVFVVRLTIFR